MSPRNRGKTVPASAREAKSRLEAARAFVSVAELVYAEPDDPVLPLRGVAAAVEVLGGIAAAIRRARRILDAAEEAAAYG